MTFFNAFQFYREGNPFDRPSSFKKDPTYINGLDEYEVKTQSHISLAQSKIFKTTPSFSGNSTQLEFVNLRPGSVVIVKIAPSDKIIPHIKSLQELITNFHYEKGSKYDEVKSIISKLNLVDLNLCLYSCDEEERDRGNGFGAYNIPGFASMVYAGFQGFLSLLEEIAPKNDLGHPFCNNLRDGNWMIDYIHQRLKQSENTTPLAVWLEKHLSPLKEMPRYLIPTYFDVIVTGIYDLLTEHALNLMPE